MYFIAGDKCIRLKNVSHVQRKIETFYANTSDCSMAVINILHCHDGGCFESLIYNSTKFYLLYKPAVFSSVSQRHPPSILSIHTPVEPVVNFQFPTFHSFVNTVLLTKVTLHDLKV